MARELKKIRLSTNPTEKALAAFRAHPIYSEVTRDVRPLRELRIADHVTSSARANCTPAP